MLLSEVTFSVQAVPWLTYFVIIIYCVKMDMGNNNEVVKWPEKKQKKDHPKDLIKEAKVKGLEHRNHSGKVIPSKTVGSDCRYA